jgi:hypothetical protein
MFFGLDEAGAESGDTTDAAALADTRIGGSLTTAAPDASTATTAAHRRNRAVRIQKGSATAQHNLTGSRNPSVAPATIFHH